MESRAVRYLLITIALLQAMALYALGTAVDNQAWPATHPPALLASYLLATGVPLFIYLSPLRRGEVLLDIAAAAIIAAALLALPILLVVTAYGLFQQVSVFGWSLVRLWALLVILALLAYALAGAWSLVRHRALVPETIGRGNTALALALIALLIAVHTPLADDDTFTARLEAAKRGEWYAAESSDPQLRFSESLVSSTVDEVPDDLFALLNGQSHLVNTCWREGYECRVERVLHEDTVFWFVYSELHFRDAQRTRNLQVSWVLWQRAGTWEQVGRLDRAECPPGNAEGNADGGTAGSTEAEPPPPAIETLVGRPGSVLTSGGCAYPIIWRVEPQVMSTDVTGRGR